MSTSSHVWLEARTVKTRTARLAYSRASPATHGQTAHMHQCEPASSHAWLDRARRQPCMAGRRTCISVSPPPAMHGSLARVASHTWLDGAHASVWARVEPCVACSRASPATHGQVAHMHECEPASSHAWLASMRRQPCMAGRRTCISVSPRRAVRGMLARVTSHAWLDGAHACECEPASSHAWLDRARLQPRMAGRRTCMSASPPPAMHGSLACVASHAWLDGAHASV